MVLLRRLLWTGGLIATAAPAANADMGVPMIFVTVPLMLAALVPIVAVEAIVMTRRLSIPYGRSLKVCGASNLVSTLVGIPVTWVLLVVLEGLIGGDKLHRIDTFGHALRAIVLEAPWLFPYERALDWIVPAAQLVLLVPYFFASWLVEYGVSRMMLRDQAARGLSRSVLVGNAASYAILAVFLACMLWLGLHSHAG